MKLHFVCALPLIACLVLAAVTDLHLVSPAATGHPEANQAPAPPAEHIVAGAIGDR